MLCEVRVQEWLCLIIFLMYAAKHCIHSVGRIQMCWDLIMYIASVNQNVITCSHLFINEWIRLYEKYILLFGYVVKNWLLFLVLTNMSLKIVINLSCFLTLAGCEVIHLLMCLGLKERCLPRKAGNSPGMEDMNLFLPNYYVEITGLSGKAIAVLY